MVNDVVMVWAVVMVFDKGVGWCLACWLLRNNEQASRCLLDQIFYLAFLLVI